jgi:hypothetical protein
MRSSKMLGLAVMAALALTAFVGAGTASATRLCSVAGTGTPTVCSPATNVKPSGTVISAAKKTGTNVVLTTSGGAVNPTLTCTASTVSLTTTSAGGGAGVNVTGNLTTLTFTGCTSTSPSGCSSSATVSGLPTAGFAAWTSGNNGDLTANAPTVRFTCPIFGFPVNCSFGGTGSVTGQVTGGTPAEVKFTNQAIAATGGGFGCPASAVWNATYTVSSPAALYVTNS